MDRNGDFQPFPMQRFGENHPIETIIDRCFRSQVCIIQSSLIPVSHIFKPNVFKWHTNMQCDIWQCDIWHTISKKLLKTDTPPKFNSSPLKKWWERKTILSYLGNPGKGRRSFPIWGELLNFGRVHGRNISMSPRICQNTPGTYPRPRTNSLWRNSFHLGVWGGLGYAPGVCWGSLRIRQTCLEPFFKGSIPLEFWHRLADEVCRHPETWNKFFARHGGGETPWWNAITWTIEQWKKGPLLVGLYIYGILGWNPTQVT